MHAFSRLTSFILFVLSLSIFAHALPAPGATGALSTRDAKCDSLANVLVDLKAKVDVCVSVMIKSDALADVTPQLDLIVGHVETCARDIVAIGQVNDADDVVKLDIAAKVAAIIAVIVKACLKLTVKFGIEVLLELFVKIDAALKLLTVNIGVCIDGIVISISKIVLATCAHIIVKLDFKLCAEALAFVDIGLN
ncbi:unnamed protein product [Rhizoctonia solani]|uniref:Transmembrane protein n=1 Tax=Rhizoctonia solani TaxID=456999 RepID=A0A8H3HMK8_9AGAM|nr:unnamed protein product [Rhizoctonia solani]